MKLHQNAKSSLILANGVGFRSSLIFLTQPYKRCQPRLIFCDRPADRLVEEGQALVISVFVGAFALNSCELLVVAKFGEAQTFTLIAYFSAWCILILVINFL
jgi:hypothetical protein